MSDSTKSRKRLALSPAHSLAKPIRSAIIDCFWLGYVSRRPWISGITAARESSSQIVSNSVFYFILNESRYPVTQVTRILVRTTAAVAAACAITQASAETFHFGDLLSGTFTPSGSFASLTVNQLTGSVFNFTLTTGNLDALFNSGTFIGSMASNLLPVLALPTISSVSGGVGVVDSQNGGGPTGVWDFRYSFGQGQDRLEANESVSWTASFAAPVSLTGNFFALHVQGLSAANGGSAWYTPLSPIPEPEVYAMMTVGLGLVAFAVRRRKNRSTGAA